MKHIKINWQRIGSWTMDMLRGNAGTIVGGVSMIGLALLCKKLDIPYQVLTDPFGGDYTSSAKSRPSANFVESSLILMPNNAAEASIAAICDNAKTMRDDYYKNKAVGQIVDILESADEVDDNVRTYAIMCIRSIAAVTNDGYYRTKMIEVISNIGKGEY